MESLDNSIVDTVAGWTASYQQAYLWSLVLYSAHIQHELKPYGGRWTISVAEEMLDAAVAELEAYEHENKNWPPPKNEPEGLISFHKRHPPTVLLMGILLLFFAETGPWSSGDKWFRAGAVDSIMIKDHAEWWRLVTGLTLHADAVHMVGNVIIGGIMIHFLCKILGSGLGWLLVFIIGMMGNAMNIFARDGAHLAVGFSTAVFGVVGLLSGLEMRRGFNIKAMLLPLGAGVGLLAMLGAGGARTDLGAHLWGLFCGIAAGLALASFPSFLKWSARMPRQILFFAAAVSIVVGSWWLALTHT